MDKVKDDNYYVEKMIKSINRITKTMKDITYDIFYNNDDIQDICMFNLIQISENAKKLSEEYKNKHSNIPWSDLYGLINRIVHDYGNVLLDTVFYTLVEDIPELAVIISNDLK